MAFCFVGVFMDQEQAMGEESGGDNKVKETIDAVTGLIKAVPIYQDALQPVAKQLGKSLETVGKAINVALAPVGALVWGYEKCQEFISTTVADRLKDVPPEDIITPKPNVAGPAIEALRYTGHEESLSDMYANLLAAAMDKKTASGAHPAFVEIIKQMTPDEAKLMALLLGGGLFPVMTVQARRAEGGSKDALVNLSLLGNEANLEHRHLTPTYLDNLCRLGLIEIPDGQSYTDKDVYGALEKSSEAISSKAHIESLSHTCYFKHGLVKTTTMGKQFGKICVKPVIKNSEKAS